MFSVDDVARPPAPRVNTWSVWAPIVVQGALTLLTLGVLYGRLSGRLDLIEYRLAQIEKKVGL